MDLDHFKDVNDTLGHPVGDLLLQSVAARLRAVVRETDTVARFGGDEFALIETGLKEPAGAAILAGKVLAAVSAPLSLQGKELRSGASLGIAVYGPDSPDAESLLSHPDVALYRAKSEGRGTYRFFTDAMDAEVHLRVAREAELRTAIGAGRCFCCTSRRSTPTPDASWASKRWCAGAIRRAAWSRPASSFRSLSKAG